MKLSYIVLFSAMSLLVLQGPAAAVSIVEIDSIDSTATNVSALHSVGIAGANSVHLASYHCLSGQPCVPDGGEGLLIQKTPGSTACTEDSGSIFKDHNGVCFYRQNLNGDLRQWGITAGSLYDASRTAATSVAASDLLIGKAITALTSAGIQTIHTGQVSVLLDGVLTLPAGWALTCDTPPVKRAHNANYTNVPGSIILAHGSVSGTVFIDAATNHDVEVYNCAAILPEWYINPSKAADFHGYSFDTAGSPPGHFDYPDLEAIRADMILAGDFAIKAGQGAKIHDVLIAGFDNCLYATSAVGFLGKNVSMDCSVGAYFSNENGGITIKDFDNNPYLTKQPGFDNEEYWTIDSVDVDTSNGQCQLKLTSDSGQPKTYSLGDIQDSNSTATGAMAPSGWRGDPFSYPAWVTGLGNFGMSCLSTSTGEFGNDAAWVVQKVGDASGGYQRVDLVGSKFTSSPSAGTLRSVDTQGDWLANTGVVRITGSISNLTPGMVVTSMDSSWPSPSATVTAVIQRCTGPDAGANTNDGYNGCIAVTPAPAAGSAGATLHFYSVSDPPTPIGTPCNGTGSAPCFFYNAGERYVAGNSDAGNSSARLPTSRGGHFGAGFLLDNLAGLRAVNIFSFAHYYNTATIDAAECGFVQIRGDENGELNAGNATGIYVSGFSRGCSFLSQGPGQKGASLVQDTFGTADAAYLTANGSYMTTLGQYGVSNGTNYVTVASTGSFISRGVMHVCAALSTTDTTKCDLVSKNEFVDETVVDTTRLSVNVRGRFGTAPVDWAHACSGGTACSTVYIFPTTINNGSSKHADKSALTVFSDLNDPTTANGNQFEIQHGAASLIDVHSTLAGVGFISTNTSGVSITAAGQPDTSLIFEDENARALTTITPDSEFANYVAPGVLNQPISYRQWFGAPQFPTNINSEGANGTGSVNVQDTSNWPSTGILLADSEYIAYHVVDSGKLSLDQRGLCGSAPSPHNNNAAVSYINVMFGCPTFGQGLPQFTLDASGGVNFAQSALAHGQVYMDLNGTNIRLCPYNGKGLIINGTMRTVPAGCDIVPTSQAANNSLNYVYAVYHQVGVTNIAGNGTPAHVRLYVTDATDFYAGTPITCYGITATPAANVVENNNTTTGTDGTGLYIDLTNITFTTSTSGTETGACSYIGLQLNTTGHSTGPNGVEIKGAPTAQDPTQTLVGMAYAGASHSVSDAPAKRDVASWFNRRAKTCRNNYTADRSTNSTTSYGEPNSEIQCYFVTWGLDDASWAANGTVYEGAAGSNAYASVGFDGTTNEPEQVGLRLSSATTLKSILALSGSKSSLTEGRHYITLLGKVDVGTNSINFGATSPLPPTSIEVRLLQ